MALVKVENVRTVADISVCRVDERTDADLVVCVTDMRGISGNMEHIWTYVENNGDATIKIFWDEVTQTADLKVLLADDIAVAGWQIENHPLKGKLA